VSERARLIRFHAGEFLVEAYQMVGIHETGDELLEILQKNGHHKTKKLVKELQWGLDRIPCWVLVYTVYQKLDQEATQKKV